MRRVNLLRAHGSPTQYLYTHHGCRCASCRGQQSAYQSAYRADPDRIKKTAAYNAAYHAAHRDELHVSKAAYRAANHEAISVQKAAYYQRDSERIKAQVALSASRNPERVRANGQAQRARKRNARGTHTAADIRSQHDRQRGRCFYCHERLTGYHIDHVVPLSKGGSNGPENIVITCAACNQMKSDKHPMDFTGRMF